MKIVREKEEKDAKIRHVIKNLFIRNFPPIEIADCLGITENEVITALTEMKLI